MKDLCTFCGSGMTPFGDCSKCGRTPQQADAYLQKKAKTNAIIVDGSLKGMKKAFWDKINSANTQSELKQLLSEVENYCNSIYGVTNKMISKYYDCAYEQSGWSSKIDHAQNLAWKYKKEIERKIHE